ncbi:MAG: CAP domain-containing protein [Candidatus Dojkabacteria bacterium]|nr:CAP domain-containing protein [Candidatus Dojkabacteria bacterium]
MAGKLLNLIIPRYQNGFYPLLLRKKALAVFTVGLLGLNMLSNGAGLGIFAGSVSSSDLVALTNQERAAAGLSSLQVDARLTSAAHAKAQNIFTYQYWSHYGPNGETPWQFILGQGYEYVYAGENLAKGFSSSEAVHNAWMASVTHRDNIMSGNYRDIGIAVVEGTLLGDPVILVVQMFGTLQSAPAVSTIPSPPVSAQPSVQAQAGTVPQQVSISIDYPEPESTIADNEMVLYGTADGPVESVIVTDNAQDESSIECTEGEWSYRPESPWSEGVHDVIVSDEDRSVTDSVSFTIDTLPPSVAEGDVTITYSPDGKGVSVSVTPDDTTAQVVLVAGNFTVLLEKDDDGGYSAEVLGSELSEADEVLLAASDQVGNTSEVDITNLVKNVLGEQTGHSQAGGLVLGIGDFSSLVTKLAIIGIGTLLVIDVVYLFKLNILHTRGKTIIHMALWVLLLCVGLFVDRAGTIL